MKREDDRCSASDFSEYDIAISYHKKSEIVDIIHDYISNNYNFPLYLQWVTIEIEKSEGKITEEFMGCRFNTFKKESKEYGHIVPYIELVSGKSFSFDAIFGDDKNIDSLKETKQVWSNLNELDNILKVASEKMEEENGDKKRYGYTLEIDKKIKLYNGNNEYIYDNEKNIFLR